MRTPIGMQIAWYGAVLLQGNVPKWVYGDMWLHALTFGSFLLESKSFNRVVQKVFSVSMPPVAPGTNHSTSGTDRSLLVAARWCLSER